MSPTMSDNTHSSSAPLAGEPTKSGYERNNTNFTGSSTANGTLINVEPPRREDLQPSYAQTLVGESDQLTHGWYSSMSMSSKPYSFIERAGDKNWAKKSG